MPTNPYDPPNEPCEPPARAKNKLPPKTLGEALWRGGKAGWKWTTYIIGPVALLLFLVLKVLERNGYLVTTLMVYDTVLEVSADGTSLSLYLGSCFWGILVGTFVACVRYALGWRNKEA
jgi:hypothetical protein